MSNPRHRQLFLEVGVGGNDFVPLPTPLVGVDGEPTPIDFENTFHYLGIDMPLDTSRSWRNIHAWSLGDDLYTDEKSRQDSPQIAAAFNETIDKLRKYRPDASMGFALADAQDLPLGDGVAEEIYMANVAGSQMYDEALERLFRDTRRVIRRTGRLVIRENITPQWVPEDVEEMLRKSGFLGQIVRHEFGSDAYNEMVEQYGLTWPDVEPHGPFADNNFFMSVKPEV